MLRLSYWRALLCPEVPQQPLECYLVGGVILPAAEIRDEVLTDLAGRVLAGIGVEVLPVADLREGYEADREQYAPTFGQFLLACMSNLRLHPFAIHSVVGEDKEQTVVEANCIVNLLVEFPATLNAVRRKPAAHASILQVGME